MKLYSIISFVFAFLLFGCNPDSQNKDKQDLKPELKERVEFKDYHEQLPNYTLPLLIKCGFKETLYEEEFKATYDDYIPEGLEAIGKIKSNLNYKVVLYAMVGDILYPFVYTTDDDGFKIDSLYLHISTCAGDGELEMSTWTIIEEDFTIKMTDSLKHYHMEQIDSNWYQIPDSVSISHMVYNIDSNGFFHINHRDSSVQLPTQPKQPWP